MQAELTIANSTAAPLESSSFLDSSSYVRASSVAGKIGSLMARVFGCRHAELSRPFSRDGHAYRSCVNCGAQRQFNLGNWQMQGSFYYVEPQ